MTDDELIQAIRERVADPDRRLDSRPSEFFASAKGMNLGQLFSAGRQATADALRAARGDLDGELLRRASAYEEAMNRPAQRPLPAPATPEALERAEARMGLAIPPLLRRLYGEVANGGFGPSSGIIGIQGGWTDQDGRTVEALFAMMSEGDPDEPRWRWPAGLVPIVDESPAWTCIDASDPRGPIVDFDWEEIEYGGWNAAFSEVAPSVEQWLSDWVVSRPAHEVQQEQLIDKSQASLVETARRSRELIAQMSIEERRAMGLPDEGWERVVWGGLGLDEDR